MRPTWRPRADGASRVHWIGDTERRRQRLRTRTGGKKIRSFGAKNTSDSRRTRHLMLVHAPRLRQMRFRLRSC